MSTVESACHVCGYKLQFSPISYSQTFDRLVQTNNRSKHEAVNESRKCVIRQTCKHYIYTAV